MTIDRLLKCDDGKGATITDTKYSSADAQRFTHEPHHPQFVRLIIGRAVLLDMYAVARGQAVWHLPSRRTAHQADRSANLDHVCRPEYLYTTIRCPQKVMVSDRHYVSTGKSLNGNRAGNSANRPWVGGK